MGTQENSVVHKPKGEDKMLTAQVSIVTAQASIVTMVME
jgi:hypothetical protein